MRNITKLGLLPAATVATMTTMAIFNADAANAGSLTKGGITLEILGNDCPSGWCSDLATGGYSVSGGAITSGDIDLSAKTPGTDDKSNSAGFDGVNTAAQVQQYNITSLEDVPPDAATDIVVTGLNGAFDFLWGSVDTFNQISFFKDGILTSLADFTGIDVAGLVGVPDDNDNQGSYHFDAYVNFFGDFDEARLTNVLTGDAPNETRVAFEVATDVPEPASLLGLAVVGLVSGSTLLSRKKQAV